ncbi:MAG TPA: response regulator [Bryobacteraceae bacterium]|jgi:CheY-like chemotaxis protein
MQNCAVLHVEDDDATAYLFRAALDSAGLSVSVYRVCDGEHALAFLRKSGIYERARTPKLIVLDANLPRVDGWAVLRELQNDSSLRRIPVVMFTTSSHPEDEGRALKLGARRFITKPSSFDTLVVNIRELCSEYLS